jgi:hypothetical protein
MTKEEFKIEKLVEMRNELNARIQSYKDGYFYICNVRSYGRNWKENYIYNTYTLQELCYQYDGQDGIVDVYSTNPNLKDVHNYGNLMYIESQEDYDNWYGYKQLERLIPEIKKELDTWDNRDNTPFRNRPMLTPVYTRKDLAEYELKLGVYDMSFVAPVRVKVIDRDHEEE